MPVYREKNKKKWTKDGRSYYFATYYTDIYGNRKKKISKLYLKSSEAKEAEREFIQNNKNKSTVKAIDFESAYNEWFEYKKSRIKSSSFYRDKKTMDKHVLSYFKPFKDIHKINVTVLLNWKKQMENKKLSISYTNICIGHLQEILNYFVNNYDFDIKIATKLQKIKEEDIELKEPTSKENFWTYEEFKKFIKNVDNDFYYTLFNFMYFTGVRYGEMNALNWNDIDFDKKTLRINKTLTDKVIGGGYKITTPKTSNSNRIIDLNDKLLDLLKKHFNSESKIYGFNKDMFIFGNIRFLPSTTFRRQLKQYINKTNEDLSEEEKIKIISPHGFRHSHASLLIYLGCDSRDVAERLGDTVQMVEKTYYHMFPSKKKHTVEMLNKL